jgi:hypothetical protein
MVTDGQNIGCVADSANLDQSCTRNCLRFSMRTQRLMICFDAEERRELERAAKRVHRPAAQLVRAVMLDWLAAEDIGDPRSARRQRRDQRVVIA